jgi:hypothetical protein
MTPPRRHPGNDDCLVDDVLTEDPRARNALAATLITTRQAAAGRRRRRRLTRAAGTLVLLAGLAVAATRWHRSRATSPALAASRPASSPSSPSSAFVSVTTRKDWAPRTVATTPPPAGDLKTSTDSVVVISTPAATPPFSPATEADLFAAAGSRPAALRRHRDGTGHWVWLDQQPRPR